MCTFHTKLIRKMTRDSIGFCTFYILNNQTNLTTYPCAKVVLLLLVYKEVRTIKEGEPCIAPWFSEEEA